MDKQLERYLPIFKQQMDNWVNFNDEEWVIFTKYLQLKALHTGVRRRSTNNFEL